MSLENVFEEQAQACAALGSPFTASLLPCVFPLLHMGNPVGQRILNWPGDPSVGADSVPLRLAGGLHALVLNHMDDGLTAVYPPCEPSDADLRMAVQEALTNNAETLLKWLESAPQTNESGRSAPLLAAGHLLAKHYNMPLNLLELGASAGLNLRWEHVLLDLGDRRLGPQNADLILKPDWQGPLPDPVHLIIANRAGVDLNPLDPTTKQDRLRLLSYIWPDQPERISRMRAALDLAAAHPVKIDKSDAIDWLDKKLRNRPAGEVTVVFHTVAWQYFPPEKQKTGQALIEAHGAKATSTAPFVWLSMENDGQPSGANLTMRLWPGNHSIALGRADFHGRWVNWQAGPSLPSP